MEVSALLLLFFLFNVNAVNKGLIKSTEIAYGTTVDYSSMKVSYPFMARLVNDGEKCGGAVIASR